MRKGQTMPSACQVAATGNPFQQTGGNRAKAFMIQGMNCCGYSKPVCADNNLDKEKFIFSYQLMRNIMSSFADN
jgi:hypothetical protein